MLARGRSSATTAELSELLGVAPDLVRIRLNPYVHRGQWFRSASRRRARLPRPGGPAYAVTRLFIESGVPK